MFFEHNNLDPIIRFTTNFMNSINENPKESQIKQSISLGYKDSLFSSFWQNRILNFFNTIIPQSQETNKLIVKKNSLNDFISDIERSKISDHKNIEYIIILIPFSEIFDVVNFLNLSGVIYG